MMKDNKLQSKRVVVSITLGCLFFFIYLFPSSPNVVQLPVVVGFGIPSSRSTCTTKRIQPFLHNNIFTISSNDELKIRKKRSTTTNNNGLTILRSKSNSDNNDQTTTATTTNTNNNKKLDSSVRTKLVSESIAPWRTLRLFLYGSLGSGAFIGGIITLTGTAALLSGAKEGNINTELLNLGIDFGAVLIFVLLFRWDIKKQTELQDKVEDKLLQKKENMKKIKELKIREQEIGSLQLSVQVGYDNNQIATIRELQFGAKQHLIIIAGPKKACRDALIGANLLKMDFAMSNVLVVPFDTDLYTSDEIVNLSFEQQTKGFVDNRPKYETQPYVAKPTGLGWYDYIRTEINDAIEQNGNEIVRDEGIAIVVASNGKVLRRGIGKVPWRLMVEQLDQSLKDEQKTNSLF